MKSTKFLGKRNIIAGVIINIPTIATAIWTIFFTPNAHIVIKIIAGALCAIPVGVVIWAIVARRKTGLYGIVRVHSKDNDYSEIVKRFDKAKHSIEIIVYHGNNFLHATKSRLIDALKRDVDVKILLAKGDSAMMGEVWELEGKNQRHDYKGAVRLLKEIKSEANGKTCWVKWHKYNTQARYALIIVDGEWAWWTPYHPGLNVPETSSFVLKDTGKKSIIHECKKHFRTLWVQLAEGKIATPQSREYKQDLVEEPINKDTEGVLK